jgi:hypothetical protein
VVTPLHEYHDAFPGGLKWRLTQDGVQTEPGIHPRTDGAPVTIKRIWSAFSEDAQHWAFMLGLPVELILATVATESRADFDPRQDRKEPGYVSDEATPNRVSIGLCHPLISTARGVTGFAIGRNWLQVPRNNLMVAALVLRSDARATRLDIPKCFARYNSGTIAETQKNPFKMRSTGDHIMRGVKFYNDAVAVVREKAGDKTVERDHEWLLATAMRGLT